MREKEFRKEEYLVQLKFTALLSVDEINELKEEIPEFVKKRIEHYNYPYIFQKDKAISIKTMNMYGIINCNISKFNKISEEEKEFMNNEVAQIRKNGWWEFTKDQSAKISEIYDKMEKEIKDLFNNSPLFGEKFK